MSQYATIEIVDQDGWEKEYVLQKSIIHIGSDPKSDLVLEPRRGAGVAPLHAQLIVSTGASGCQLVNLGNTAILFGPSGDRALSPRSVTRVVNGTIFKLGDFTLTFRSDREEAGMDVSTTPSENIGLNVSLPQTRLAANQSLEGVITVSNLGDQAGVQFSLEVEGLDADCYGVEPAPLLSSGAEEDVFFRIHHRGSKPLVGDCRVTIRAAAPRAYPGEQATVSRVIQVLPFYHHKLRIAYPAGTESRVSADEVAPPPPKLEAKPVSPSHTEDWWAPDAEEVASPQPQVAAPPGEEVKEVADAIPGQAPKVEIQVETPEPLRPEVGVLQEVEPELPTAVAAQAAEEALLPVEVVSSPLVEDEGTVAAYGDQEAEVSLQPDVEPALEVEEEPVLGAEMVGPTATEAGEAPVPEPALPDQVEGPEVPEPKVSPPPKVVPAPAAQVRPPSKTRDWWWVGAGDGPGEPTQERQVLKMKASPPVGVEAEPAPAAEGGPPPPAEDWWWPEDEDGPDEPARKQPALKLKASPPPDAEPVQAEAGPSPTTEDWWSPGAEISPEEPVEKQ